MTRTSLSIGRNVKRTNAINAASAKDEACQLFRQRPSNKRMKLRAFGSHYDVRKDDSAICVCGFRRMSHG